MDDGGAEVIGYILEMMESGAEEWTKAHEKTLRTSEHVMSGLSSSKKYCFRVAGININGTGDFSEACIETEPVERIGMSTTILLYYEQHLSNYELLLYYY